MSFRYPAGVVGAAVTPSGPYQTSTAPGIWSLAGQANFQAQSLWPTQGNFVPAYLWSWGSNTYGNLGLGNTTSYSSPKQIGLLSNWLTISVGGGSNGDFVSSIKTDGTLWTWGRNQSGQLGTGNTTSYSSPKQVGALTTWLYVAIGEVHTVATKTDGTVWTWGYNFYGNLGLGDSGTINNRSSPVQVGALTDWSKVAAGNNSCMVIKTNGTLWGWGRNHNGQLGDGTVINRSSPVQVGALTTWLSVACGWYHTLATKTDGTLWAWGKNEYGALGLGNTTYYSSPVQVGALTAWLNVCGSQYSSVVTKSDGTLWSWGRNNSGQLGLGNVTDYSSPKQVGALTTWSKPFGGGNSIKVIKTNGTLSTWGENTSGQLGLGNITSYSSPKQVGSLTTWINIGGGKAFVIGTISA